eukprot:6479282-Prymnesium_polylepis.1
MVAALPVVLVFAIVSPRPAVLRVREPKSRTDVILVGTMHCKDAGSKHGMRSSRRRPPAAG